MEKIKQKIIDKLREVLDPELNINVVDLGLIYDVEIQGKKAHIIMSFTSPGCPMVRFLAGQVESKALEVEEIDDVLVEVVWDPPWTPEKMSREAREALGI
ncbi:metal-sulfur cluster assembly factor [Candidatus Micrarchaeota archaeon]|nr:metal-sulfur cluster assembly factor [Candidatus Micrarchaeota archaeon]